MFALPSQPIARVPHFTLDAWSVYEVPMDGEDKPWTRHFSGFSREGCNGRVSSPVESFDPATRCGLTRSGRVYLLEGFPGMNGDAFYVWGRWKTVNRITFGMELDISEEVYAEILRASARGTE